MAYGDFKDLRSTVSGKGICKKAFEVASNQKYDGHHTCKAVCKCFDKKAKYQVY